MRSIFLWTVCLLLQVVLVRGQAPSSRPRHAEQQRYMLSHFIQQKKAFRVQDTAELNHLFTQMQAGWQRYVQDSLSLRSTLAAEVMKNLDPYTYYWCLMSVTGKNALPPELDYHLYKYYMLPALQRDLAFLRQDPSLIAHPLIWPGALNTVSLGVPYDADSAAFTALYRAVRDLRAVAETFQDQRGPNGIQARKILGLLDRYTCELEAKYHWLLGHPDQAFTYLITGLSNNQFPQPRSLLFGQKLAEHYRLQGESAKARAILNNLAWTTTPDELPRDSLQAWYIALDSGGGKRALNATMKSIQGKKYVLSSAPAVRLPTTWNFIAQSLPEARLRGVKYLLIDFWYSACAPCLAEMPALNAFYDLTKDRQDVLFLSINADYFTTRLQESDVLAVIRQQEIRFPVVYDNGESRLAEQLKVAGYPARFILTTGGRLMEKANGGSITLLSFSDFLSHE